MHMCMQMIHTSDTYIHAYSHAHIHTHRYQKSWQKIHTTVLAYMRAHPTRRLPRILRQSHEHASSEGHIENVGDVLVEHAAGVALGQEMQGVAVVLELRVVPNHALQC